MKAKPNPLKIQPTPMKKLNHNRTLPTIAWIFLLMTILLVGSWSLAQTAPVLTVVPAGTNALSITVTNGNGTSSYELWTTPVLGNNIDYPWTIAAVGTNSQTNFTVQIGPFDSGFFRAAVDTNAIPLWEAADPNNPGAGILAVFIDTPTNGATLQ